MHPKPLRDCLSESLSFLYNWFKFIENNIKRTLYNTFLQDKRNCRFLNYDLDYESTLMRFRHMFCSE